MKILEFKNKKLRFKEATLKQELLSRFIVVIVSVSVFWTGMHNLDLGQNMKYLEVSVNRYFALYNVSLTYKLSDTTIGGITNDSQGVYLSGIKLLWLSFFMLLYSAFNLGVTFNKLKND